MNNTLTRLLDADRQRALANVRAAADRIWSRPLHRYYTDHTVAHSQRIIALLEGLTAGMMATSKLLSPTEAFVLLAAAYLHDIGMQSENLPQVGNLREVDLEAIRAIHHELTAELIYRAAEDPSTSRRGELVEPSGRRLPQAVDLGLPDDPGLVEAVALVAKGHRQVDLRSPEYEPLAHGGETLRLRLLAALLRFADELDIDHRRVHLEQMKLLTLPVESQLHWWKCHYVGGVGILDEYIRIAYRFPQDRPDYEPLIVPLVERDVRAKHAVLEQIFRAHAVKVALGPSQVRLMRAVQPLPPEVEALARQAVEAGVETSSRPAPPAPVPAPTGKPAAPATSPPPRPAPPVLSPVEGKAVFDQRGQTVTTQINVAGDYVDQRTGILDREKDISSRPTPPELDRFIKEDFAGLENALHYVWVSVSGRSFDVKYSPTSNWNSIVSRVPDTPKEIRHVLDEIVTTRELAWGGPAKLSREQLSSAKRGIDQILRFLHQQFPAAAVELPSPPKGEGEPSGPVPPVPGSHPDATVVAPTSAESDSLRHQLAEARENLRLIEEREAEYVMSTDIPLQMTKEKRRLQQRIAELEARLA